MFRKIVALTVWGAILTFGVAAYAGGERVVINRTKAAYPELAKRMNVQGTVTVKALVAADGKVKSVSPVSGNPILSQAAQAAVKQWVYAPGAEESITVEMTFSNTGQ